MYLMQRVCARKWEDTTCPPTFRSRGAVYSVEQSGAAVTAPVVALAVMT
jgi:hypothetical protein